MWRQDQVAALLGHLMKGTDQIKTDSKGLHQGIYCKCLRAPGSGHKRVQFLEIRSRQISANTSGWRVHSLGFSWQMRNSACQLSMPSMCAVERAKHEVSPVYQSQLNQLKTNVDRHFHSWWTPEPPSSPPSRCLTSRPLYWKENIIQYLCGYSLLQSLPGLGSQMHWVNLRTPGVCHTNRTLSCRVKLGIEDHSECSYQLRTFMHARIEWLSNDFKDSASA